jgi:capsular exopolysaccharide synthesis family protein
MLHSTPNALISSEMRHPHGAMSEERTLTPPLILQYWQVAVRWKWIIIGLIISSLVTGLIATLLMTPKYTSRARIEISRNEKNITNVAGVESASSGRDLEFYQTQYSLLQARSLAERVARDLRLATDPDFFAAHGQKLDPDTGLFTDTGVAQPAALRARNEDRAVGILLRNINVGPIRGSSLVDISYTSASPELSTRVANSWTQQFIEASMARRFASTSDARRFLEGRLADLRSRLEESERELVSYASSRDIVSLGRAQGPDGRTQNEKTLAAANLEALNSALADATADRLRAESRARLTGSQGTNSDVVNNVSLGQLRQKRAEVAAEYARQLVQFEAGYPTVRALAEQLRVLDASIAREEMRINQSRSTEFLQAVQREERIRSEVERLKARLDQQQRDTIQYNIYQREVDTNRQLYDGLLQRYKEIGVAGVGANNIAIVDSAKLPNEPSSPNLLFNLALALVLGIGVAGLATFALDQIDEGLRDPNQVNRILRVPLLGSVPDVEDEDALEQLKDNKSALSESYLSIRSNLAFSTDHGVPRSLMITSTRPAEGKSTTSVALAYVLGRTGKKVLLIDGDMRSPSMHEFFSRENAQGLSNYLAGENNWHPLVGQTDMKGLDLMPAGPMPPSASELLSSERMSALVKSLLTEYDHVVVDAPPILGLADAPLLSGSVEGCIFVVEAEGVSVRGVKAALERLHAVHAHVLGVILTKLKQRQAGYGYGYSYGYGYGSSDENG